ncbi:translation initiation factor IF-2 [Tissierella praeacuta DSM 18095]|uniref:Translation initiation factor IF-2 n=2 Tax=Tissierella praeacuta TaxID=43131 RepID=A0A1M4SIQ2_9FIRM|nr:translation initiation factor IF-2 [Tissierella praeacuta]SHE32113.1 translation initiation factor IF-2 [Tissierella praeacuta DSM 18095]SUP01469.1 Translation initiation factor IF-2 [Tissierella praeacuta]
MKKIRIYELARELGISSKDLIEKISELDISVGNHMSTLENEEAEIIKSLLSNNEKKDDSNEKIHSKGDNIGTKENEENIKVKTVEGKNNKKHKSKKQSNKSKLKNNNMNKENNIIGKEGNEVVIEIESNIIVKDLADKIDVSPSQIISKLIGLGVMVNQNQAIDSDIAIIVAEEFGVELKVKEVSEDNNISLEEEFNLDYEDDPKDLKTRAPIVTVMGHVDHGKTSLLDAIKETSVTKSEAGGITQHIGAYAVNINNKKICFLDTPGHEAFTSMRARGAQVTDIAILVVAADDGVMPQTIEAINHAKAANVPIIVAINKMDKPTANVDRIKQELVENSLVPEDWGGDTITVPVSAKNRVGIEELLEMILLVAEMQELKANPNRNAVGTIVEAQLDKGKGPLATVLVQKGTLQVGDIVVSGSSFGRVRAMLDDKGKRVKKAGPSMPVVILGLSEVPNAGDLLYAVEDEKIGRSLAEKNKEIVRAEQMRSDQKVSLDDLFERIKLGEIKDLNIIIKGDVRGSIEALKQSLEKLDTEEVKTNIIHGGVGGITESDIMLASASNAIVVGFNVRPNLNAIEVAKREKVDVRTYRVIYEAIEDIQAAIKGMHAPKIVEEVIGRAEVRATFRLPNGSTIAGIYVLDGKIARNGKVRLLRNDIVIFEGDVSSLKRFKDDAREVLSGYEAGLGLENYNDIKEGDLLEAYVLKEVEK